MVVTRTRKIKRFIKISVAIGIIGLAVVLFFLTKHTHTFENNNMTKWSKITDSQRIATLERVVKEVDNQDLIIACVNKIAQLPDSHEMIVRDAISLCYNGIKLNRNPRNEEK